MAITRPTGRPGPPTTDTPGSEKKARSEGGYQSGVQVGFGISGGSGMDDVPVSPKSAVHVGKDSIPSTDMTPAIGNVNKNEK